MRTELAQHTFIDTQHDLELFRKENQGVEWMGFDTEFIGERRYFTLLCLIQVATENGNYLIDTLKIKNLDPFLEFITNPDILKITHAGENDYRLLNQQFNILPVNLFDVQIASGFVGFKFPISFQKLLEKELNVYISKGYTVSDWETRPMKPKQLQYALNDVIYLRKLWQRLSSKLEKLGRTEWAAEETANWEKADFYYSDPYKEAFNNSLIFNLGVQEQAFLIRLYEWRRKEAERKNHSKEMVLQGKYIAPIVRNIRSGRAALTNHRRIPGHIIKNYWDTFNELYQMKVNGEEREVLSRISKPSESERNPDDISMQILHLLMKDKCIRLNLAIDMLLLRVDMKKMKMDINFFDSRLEEGWRKSFLGEEMIKWIKERQRLEIDTSGKECIIRLRD